LNFTFDHSPRVIISAEQDQALSSYIGRLIRAEDLNGLHVTDNDTVLYKLETRLLSAVPGAEY